MICGCNVLLIRLIRNFVSGYSISISLCDTDVNSVCCCCGHFFYRIIPCVFVIVWAAATVSYWSHIAVLRQGVHLVGSVWARRRSDVASICRLLPSKSFYEILNNMQYVTWNDGLRTMSLHVVWLTIAIADSSYYQPAQVSVVSAFPSQKASDYLCCTSTITD